MSVGLAVMALGALLFIPAARAASYPLFLLALFTLASGMTLMQTAINPYIVCIGAREVYAVLLNRDFHADIATLEVLCRRPPPFLGMMGSRRRIREVFEALPQHRTTLERLQAPIGLEIEAETPHEIAVSILAQLIQWR